MTTDADFIEYVREQAGLGPGLTHRRMFGEYALYLDGKVVAFACDNSLLLKPTEAGRAPLPTLTLGRPYPEAKDYYVLDEFLDDPDLLRRALIATAEALPAPTSRAARATTAAKGGAGTAPSAGKATGRKPDTPAAATAQSAKTAGTAKTAKTAKTATALGDGAAARARQGNGAARRLAAQGPDR